MKKQFQTIGVVSIALLMGICACSKKETATEAANLKFAGTYKGTLNGNTDSIKVTALSDASKISLLNYNSFNGGPDSVTLSGTVSGNSISSFTGSYTDVVGTTNVTGTGSLSGNTLSLKVYSTLSGTSMKDTTTFLGTK